MERKSMKPSSGVGSKLNSAHLIEGALIKILVPKSRPALQDNPRTPGTKICVAGTTGQALEWR